MFGGKEAFFEWEIEFGNENGGSELEKLEIWDMFYYVDFVLRVFGVGWVMDAFGFWNLLWFWSIDLEMS